MMIEREILPASRLFKGEKVLKSELCNQAKVMEKNLEFCGKLVGQYVLPFDGEDILVWFEK